MRRELEELWERFVEQMKGVPGIRFENTSDSQRRLVVDECCINVVEIDGSDPLQMRVVVGQADLGRRQSHEPIGEWRGPEALRLQLEANDLWKNRTHSWNNDEIVEWATKTLRAWLRTAASRLDR